MEALGFVETRSLTGSIEAADAMTKAADVKLVGTEKIGSGLVNVVVTGEIGAIKAAVAAGKEAAAKFGQVYAVNIIARPHESIEKILPGI